MKIAKIFFFPILLLGLNVEADELKCIDAALSVYKANLNLSGAFNIPKESKACISKHSDFSSISVMCEPNGALTSDYMIYKDYADQFNQKLKEIEEAESQVVKNILSSDARAIKNEWIALGYKIELYPPIKVLGDLLKNDCKLEE